MMAFWLNACVNLRLSEQELKEQGISYLFLDPSNFDAEMEKRNLGYKHHDIVELNSNTPNLDILLSKFRREHFHRDDESRYVLDGDGFFDIRSLDDRWIRISVTDGDYISIPAFRYHKFELTQIERIKAVRFFKDDHSWEPIYRGEQNGK
ncbi:acireductone dioxygenase [Candidatus Woesearchaeota archaeon]|nr:acireductone dioxygenase [Candidatus Woesearchaeota archaeon]